MRRTVTARWFGSLLMTAALALGGFRISPAAETTPTPPVPAPATAAENATDSLSKILMGGAPNTVSDLKAMQGRIQKLPLNDSRRSNLPPLCGPSGTPTQPMNSSRRD